MSLLSETGTIIRAAFWKWPDAVTPHDPPSPLVNQGQRINWTSFADWTTIGNRDDQDANDVAYFASGDIDIQMLDDVNKHKPPKGQANHQTTDLGNGIDEIVIPVYDVGKRIFELDSYANFNGQWMEPTHNPTYQSVVIEVDGICIMFLQKCKVRIGQDGGSAENVASSSLRCIVHATETYPAGYKIYFFPEAA